MSYTSDMDINHRNSMNKTLNDYRSKEAELRMVIQGFDSYTPEQRERARMAMTRKWSNVLVNEFGVDTDSDLSGHNQTGNGSEREIR